MVRAIFSALCMVILLAGCAGNAQHAGESQRKGNYVTDPRCSELSGTEILGQTIPTSVHVTEPGYIAASDVPNGAEAPDNSLHQAIRLPVYPTATELKSQATSDNVSDSYSVSGTDLAATRDAIAQFYHHKMHDLGFTVQARSPGFWNLHSCDQLVTLLQYGFTYTKPNVPPDTRESLENVVDLDIAQSAPGQLTVTLSRSSPEAIDKKLAKVTVLRREAKVIAKRTDVSGLSGYSDTHYYVTFELNDGSRVELSVSGTEFGMLAEGDRGILVTKGSSFQGLERPPS